MDSSSVLVLIVDCDSVMSSFSRNSNPEVTSIVAAVVMFCTSYRLMHRENELFILAVANGEMRVLFPETKDHQDMMSSHDFVASKLTEELWKSFDEYNSSGRCPSELGKSNAFSQSFSTALCIVRRMSQANPELRSRILVLQFDKDRSQSYNALMNSVFRCVM